MVKFKGKLKKLVKNLGIYTLSSDNDPEDWLKGVENIDMEEEDENEI